MSTPAAIPRPFATDYGQATADATRLLKRVTSRFTSVRVANQYGTLVGNDVMLVVCVRLRLGSNPILSIFQCGSIEVHDSRPCERLAEYAHPLFPFRFTDNRQPFDVIEMFEIKLQVFP